MPTDAITTMVSFSALFIAAVSGQPATTDLRTTHVEWSISDVRDLPGEFVGTLRDWRVTAPCELLRARLQLQQNGTYALALACVQGPARTLSIQGKWWIDRNGSYCLILEDPDPPDGYGNRWFGFRISADATWLSQDGADCNAADDRDLGKGLQRRGTAGG